VDFGMITVCPGGTIRPGDMPRLRQTIEFRNTGEIPLTLEGLVKPAATPLRIVSPLTWPVIVPAGQAQTITVEIPGPFDEMARQFSGVVELLVSRDQRCVTETRTIPFSGQINRLAYAFTSDTVRASIVCHSDPVDLTAEIMNSGLAPLTVDLAIEGSGAFTLTDGSMLSIPAGQSRTITVRFTPSPEAAYSARLVASESLCGTRVSTALAVSHERPSLTLSCSSGGSSAAQTARPGDVIEIPVFLAEALTCPVEGVALQFEVQFDRRSLAPDRVTSSQGVATFTRTSPDKILVRISGASFNTGEIARIAMEVLVGRSTNTNWTVAAPAFTPAIAVITADETCSGTISIRPRNGVATLSDLGITTLNPPRPNIVGGIDGEQTLLSFSLKQEGMVELKVFDILGVEVAVIHSGNFKRGTHNIRYTFKHPRPGIYFIVMTASGYRGMQKLIVAN
jgi:hypothetical protein